MTKSNSVFDTLTAKATLTPALITELVTFLIQNRTLIRLTTEESDALFSTKMRLSTPIGDVYARLLESGKLKGTTLIKIPKTSVQPPEVITYTHLPFDMLQLKSVNESAHRAISTIPEFADKVVVNVTTLVDRLGGLTDTLSFQSLVVRDALSRSFFTHQTPGMMWLSPTIVEYLCQCYMMSTSQSISGAFNLNLLEQRTIATVFAYYFFTKCSDSETAKKFMISHSSYMRLGTPTEVEDIIIALKDKLGSDFENPSLVNIVYVLGDLGIERLRGRIDLRFLNQRCQSIGIPGDVFTSRLALEYPPYWAYLVLVSMSGRRTSLYNTLKNTGLVKGAENFAEELIRAPGFIPLL